MTAKFVEVDVHAIYDERLRVLTLRPLDRPKSVGAFPIKRNASLFRLGVYAWMSSYTPQPPTLSIGYNHATNQHLGSIIGHTALQRGLNDDGRAIGLELEGRTARYIACDKTFCYDVIQV